MLSTGFVCALVAAEVLTLPQALNSLKELHPDLAIARLQVIEAEAAAGVAKSGYQPQLNAIAQTNYQTSNLQGIGLLFPGFPSRIGPFRTFNARPQATQTVLDLSLLSRIRASRAMQTVAQKQVASVQEDLAIAVVQLYLQALQAGSRADAARERLKTARAILDQASEKERVGTGSKLDVARASEQLQNENSTLIAAERDANTLQTMLLRAIGRDQVAVGLSLEKPALATDEGSRPEREVLDARLAVADLEIDAAKKERLPKVTAFGDFGALGVSPTNSIGTYAVGVSVSVPIWTGKRIENEIAQAAVRKRMVEQELRRLNLQIAQEVRQAEVERDAARAALDAAAKAAKASREVLELSRLRYESGLATSVDTQIAQSGLAASEDQRIRMEYEVLLSEARLAKASGRRFVR